MPVSSAQLTAGANYQLMENAKSDPVDQITAARPFTKWLVANKVPSIFGNGIFNEKVRFTNDSNYQNYTGDQQVTYNRKDTARLAPFQHYEAHDGFTLNETELANNGVTMTDDNSSVMTEAEEIQIVSKLNEGYETLKEGFQQNWDLEVHQDGSQSTLAVPGLDLLVSTTPATGVVGGIDASANPYWRNNASMAISTASAGTLTNQMEIMWRACTKFGGVAPDFIVCGSAFYDAYRIDAGLTINRRIDAKRGGVEFDASVSALYFKNVQVIWDPTFDALDVLLGAITYPWAKRCYFLQSKNLKLRPFKGRWMVSRKPSRVYDRYTHYFGLTADYGITVNKRNNMAVLSIL